MDLCNWLQSNNVTPNALAVRINCSPHTIARAARGEPVKPDIAREICHATNYDVDLFGLLYPGEAPVVILKWPERAEREEAARDEVA